MLYEGVLLSDNCGNFIVRCYTTEEAAEMLGLKKRSLEDYRYQLRNAYELGFDF